MGPPTRAKTTLQSTKSLLLNLMKLRRRSVDMVASGLNPDILDSRLGWRSLTTTSGSQMRSSSSSWRRSKVTAMGRWNWEGPVSWRSPSSTMTVSQFDQQVKVHVSPNFRPGQFPVWEARSFGQRELWRGSSLCYQVKLYLAADFTICEFQGKRSWRRHHSEVANGGQDGCIWEGL